MDLDCSGLSLQEGSATLLTGGITDWLLEQHRVQIVDRNLLNSLMGELKLGSSPLSDLQSSLVLGRLIAARLIITGRMVHSAPMTQVILRVVETETSKVVITISNAFDTKTPIATMAQRLVDELSLKIQRHYPIRAKVIEHHGNTLVLDVGLRHGVMNGKTFQAVGVDLTARVVDIGGDRCSVKVLQPAKGH